MQVIDIVPVLQGGEYDDGLSRCAPEQMAGRTVIAFEKPRRGAFYMATAMFETTDFFQHQINQCKAQAARAVDKSDREFWRRLAQRWEQLLQAREGTGSTVEAVQMLRPTRQIFSKRRAA
jgi:hypothetical protein